MEKTARTNRPLGAFVALLSAALIVSFGFVNRAFRGMDHINPVRREGADGALPASQDS